MSRPRLFKVVSSSRRLPRADSILFLLKLLIGLTLLETFAKAFADTSLSAFAFLGNEANTHTGFSSFAKLVDFKMVPSEKTLLESLENPDRSIHAGREFGSMVFLSDYQRTGFDDFFTSETEEETVKPCN